jgi:hypothetical protein
MRIQTTAGPPLPPLGGGIVDALLTVMATLSMPHAPAPTHTAHGVQGTCPRLNGHHDGAGCSTKFTVKGTEGPRRH